MSILWSGHQTCFKPLYSLEMFWNYNLYLKEREVPWNSFRIKHSISFLCTTLDFCFCIWNKVCNNGFAQLSTMRLFFDSNWECFFFIFILTFLTALSERTVSWEARTNYGSQWTFKTLSSSKSCFLFPKIVMNTYIDCANMVPDYYFVQPQFGYNELKWSKINMATPW